MHNVLIQFHSLELQVNRLSNLKLIYKETDRYTRMKR